MSFWDSVKGFFVTAEADVIAIVVKAKQEIDLVAHEIDLALGWIANNTPAIVADIEQVLGIVQAIGIVNPQVEAAVTAAHEAVAALDVFATAYKNGSGSAQSVVAGYAALQQAKAAAAAAKSVAVSTPAVK